jgi:hypothetical protein
MFDIEYARKLVRHQPITVSRYDSGQIGFVARPMIKGRRFCKSFSTSIYPNLEEAAAAAIAYCKEQYNFTEVQQAQRIEANPIPDDLRPQLSALIPFVREAISRGIDPAKASHDGLFLHIKRQVRSSLK